MDEINIIINTITENCTPLIITTVATIIATKSCKFMCRIIKGDYNFPKEETEEESYELPDKQKDFIQLN